MSGRPFALRVHFAAAALNPPRLASVRVEWSGEPFVHEALLTAEDTASGYVDVVFGADQTLPVGAATFAVSLYGTGPPQTPHPGRGDLQRPAGRSAGRQAQVEFALPGREPLPRRGLERCQFLVVMRRAEVLDAPRAAPGGVEDLDRDRSRGSL
jgi:hypothetical protein